MEYEDRRESWLTSEPEKPPVPLKIRDRYLDLPKRNKVINEDDITDLTIALNTCSVEEFLAKL